MDNQENRNPQQRPMGIQPKAAPPRATQPQSNPQPYQPQKRPIVQMQVQPQQKKPVTPPQQTTPKKPKSKLKFIIIGVAALIVVGVVVLILSGGKKEEPEVVVTPSPTPIPPKVQDYTNSGYNLLVALRDAINAKDPVAIDSAIGILDADSYVAHEFAYTNSNTNREYLLQRVCELFTMSFEEEQLEPEGEMFAITYNDGQAVSCTVPDWELLEAKMHEDILSIQAMYKDSGYSQSDLNYSSEMLDLMVRYITDIQELPTTTVNIVFPMDIDEEGTRFIISDAELDDYLFGSPYLRLACDTFAKICTNYTETVEVVEDNPEYVEWHEKLEKYIAEEDTEHYAVRYIYETDEEGNQILDKKKQPIVKEEYYVLINKKGKDVKEPPQTHKVTKDNPFVPEAIIPYNWCGSHYIQTEYEGTYSKTVTLGDGTFENPAGLGTPVLTKMQTTDGKYIDVEITLVNYWVRQDAINYIETLSTRNHGFTVDSKIDLLVCEFAVTNKSSKTHTFKSELMLSDDKGNKSTRTGTMFGVTDTAKIKPGETVIMNDWLTSTTLDSKYLSWGSSFARKYDVVYFAVLAGTPEVPSYSPYRENLDAILGYYGSHKYNNQDMATDSSKPTTAEVTEAPATQSGESTTK